MGYDKDLRRAVADFLTYALLLGESGIRDLDSDDIDELWPEKPIGVREWLLTLVAGYNRDESSDMTPLVYIEALGFVPDIVLE